MTLEELNISIENDKENVGLLLQRAKLHYGLNRWGSAINDFRSVLLLDPENHEAEGYIELIGEILDFRHNDTYNP